MGGFFNNPYLLYGDEEEGYPGSNDMGMVNFSPSPDDEFVHESANPDPEFQKDSLEGPGVRLIPPRFNHPAFDTYMEHVKSMPSRGDYKPSVGRRILGGLAGFLTGLKDPAMGARVGASIVQAPYEQALEEWKTKGGALQHLAGVEQDIGADELKAGGEYGRLSARMEELNAKKDQINKNYDVALRNAKNRAEYNGILRARNADLAKLGAEANRVRAIEAGASVTRANAYSQLAGEGSKLENIPRVNDVYNAEQDVLRNFVSRNPLFQKFWQIDPKTGDVSPIQGDFTPEDHIERQNLEMLIGKEVRRRLHGGTMGGVDYFDQEEG